MSVRRRIDACVFALATLAIALVASYPLPVSAQAGSTLDLIFGIDLTVELSPAHPAPGERVRVSARSGFLELPAAMLSWSVNGKPLTEGIGVAEVELAAGALGSETRLTVRALEEDFEIAIAEAIIRPVELELLWEADSYVPPFYRGRSLPSAGTALRLQAIPRFMRSGTLLSPRDLIYTWKKNGYVIASASGRGRSSAVIESPIFGTETISVEAKTQDGVLVGEKSARIVSLDPRVALYQNHPVFGITYHQMFSSENQIGGAEETFTAIPYFADVERPDDPLLQYQWKINGIDVRNDETRPSTFTINAGNVTESARIDLSLTHALDLFFSAAESWSFLFNSKNVNAPFYTTQE